MKKMLTRLAAIACLSAVGLLAPDASARELAPLTSDQALVLAVARAASTPAWLTTEERSLVAHAVDLCKRGKADEARALWLKIVQARGRAHSLEEYVLVFRSVARTALLAPQSTLLQRATQLAQARDLHGDLGAYLVLLKDLLAKFPSPPATTTTVPVKVVSAGRLTEQGSKAMTRAELQSLLGNMQKEQDQVSDMNQMLALNLQDTMQKQQQVMQALSNIMKSAHDTAKTIIDNLK